MKGSICLSRLGKRIRRHDPPDAHLNFSSLERLVVAPLSWRGFGYGVPALRQDMSARTHRMLGLGI